MVNTTRLAGPTGTLLTGQSVAIPARNSRKRFTPRNGYCVGYEPTLPLAGINKAAASGRHQHSVKRQLHKEIDEHPPQ
jgi:hypothetical protein